MARPGRHQAPRLQHGPPARHRPACLVFRLRPRRPARLAGPARARLACRHARRRGSAACVPSLALWTLFDEGNGQEALGLDAARSLAGEIARLDPARLVNGASGWFDTGNGQVRALHFSPGPAMFDPGPRRASLLARYGQLAAATRAELRRDYRALMGKLSLYRAIGLSGAIYSPANPANPANPASHASHAQFTTRAGEEWLTALHQRMLTNSPAVEQLAGGDEPWEFTLSEAGAAREGWRTGAGSFGTAFRNVQPGTPWTAPAMRLRRNFRFAPSAAEPYLVHWAIRGAQLDVRLNGEPVLHASGDGPEGAAFLSLKSHPALRNGDNLITIDARRAPNSPHAAFDARLIAVNGDKLAFADPEFTRRPEYPLTAVDNGAADLTLLAPLFTHIRGRRGRPAPIAPSTTFLRDLGPATPEQAYYALLSARSAGFDGVALRLSASTPAEREASELTIRNIQEWMKAQPGPAPLLHINGLTAAGFAAKGPRASLFFLPTPEKPTPPAAVALTGFPGTGEAWLDHLRLLLQAAQSQWPLHVEAATPNLFAYATYLLGVESKSPTAPVRLVVPPRRTGGALRVAHRRTHRNHPAPAA
ncbi:MAG: hypothetical protein IPJ98_12280 [Bryobacterales bacterium]|nr:hypothetical protein [Bryobacterales bacterium]